MKSIELIELGLNEIARECRIIDGVSMTNKSIVAIEEAKGNTVSDVPQRLAKQHDEMLKEVHKKVCDLLEFVGEYMNGQDMVTAVDLALNEAVYDLVFERKNEDDYENK